MSIPTPEIHYEEWGGNLWTIKFIVLISNETMEWFKASSTWIIEKDSPCYHVFNTKKC